MAHATLNLNQTVLRVAVNRVYPYCDFETLPNGQVTIKPAVEINYLILLMWKLNFQVELIEMGRAFGLKGSNGSWNGVIGLLNRSQAHFGMCSLSNSYERGKAADFSHYTMIEDMTLFTYAPRPIRHVWIMVTPFTPIGWFLIGLSILGLSVLHYHYTGGLTSLGRIVFEHYAIAIRQTFSLYSRVCGTRTRMLYFVWMVSGLILSTCYTGVFYSLLTVAEYEPTLDTSQQLIKAINTDKVTMRVVHKNFLDLLEKNKKENSLLFYEIFQHLRRNKLKHLGNEAAVLREVFDRKIKRRPVYFASRIYIDQLRIILKGHHELFVGSEYFHFTYVAIAFSKTYSSLLPHFNRVIQGIKEAGLPEYWIRKNMAQFAIRFKQDPVAFTNSVYRIVIPELADRKPTPSREGVSDLFLADFETIFYSWMAGLAFSVVAFLFEIIKISFPRRMKLIFPHFHKN